MPAVDYAAAGRAQGQARMQIADAINRISSFAFEQAEKQAAREGMQYRYDNPVTEEQINTALEQGRSVDEIVGSQYTVFGRASRATAGAQLRTELENKTRIQLTQIDAAHKEGLITMEQATDQISGLIRGNSQVLGSFDPDNAIAYSATANTLASTTYKEGLLREYKLRTSARVADTNVAMSTMPQSLEDIYFSDTGKLTESGMTEGQATATTALRVMQDGIIATLDPEYIKTATSDLVDLEKKARVNALVRFSLTPEMAANDEELYSKVREGDFGRLTNLYTTLTIEEQASFRTALRTEMSARDAEDERVRRDEVRNARASANSMLFDLRNFDPNSQEFNQTFTSLKTVSEQYPEIISPDTLVKLRGDIITGAERVSDPRALFEFQRAINNRLITDANEAFRRGTELGLAPKHILESITQINTAQTREQSQLRREALNYAKVASENQQNISSFQAGQVYEFLEEVENRYNKYLAELGDGERPTKSRLDFAPEVREQSINNKYTQQAERIFDSLNADFGKGSTFPTNITFSEYHIDHFDEIEGALEAAGLSPSQIEQIRSRLDVAKNALSKRLQ